ncbi:MAG: DUF4166 domain-containing protein [Pseudomonadota bacterium]|nr:DUF4166 domain-containing protein [Pseudomonadota bacterium]
MRLGLPTLPFDRRMAAPGRGFRASHDFRPLVRGGWHSLHPEIRTRFDGILGRDASAFAGAMTVRLSPVGRLFALACVPLGRPLPLRVADAVPVDIRVTRAGLCAMRWRRDLGTGPDRKSCCSRKTVDPYRGLLEVVDGGLGMCLEVRADHGDLVFESRGFFLRLGRLHIPLPLWLTPGRARVEHRQVAGDRFRYRLTFRHPLFGLTVEQDGIFAPRGELQ